VKQPLQPRKAAMDLPRCITGTDLRPWVRIKWFRNDLCHSAHNS